MIFGEVPAFEEVVAFIMADSNDALQQAGFVSFTNKAKSVTITADGADEAHKIPHMLGLSHLAE